MIRLGRLVRVRLVDIEAYEAARLEGGPGPAVAAAQRRKASR